jgi:uncharacterized iron-regulated protein
MVAANGFRKLHWCAVPECKGGAVGALTLWAIARRFAALLTTLLASCATGPPAPLSANALADAISRRPVVLLGEVHDNATQHALRAEALRRLLASGARPALAFEQFDRDRQQDLDDARIEALSPGTGRVDHLIARAGASGWSWNFYRPYLQLAIDHDLPIVAANLSRSDAMRVAQQGFGATFDVQQQAADPPLEQLPSWFVAEHQRAVDIGHCKLIPSSMLPSLARAQIARDLTLAQTIRPYAGRGVVLLSGNGHVRNDIGVPYFLTAAERARTVTIGLLESDDIDAGASAMYFDVVMLTPAQIRPDRCDALRKQLPREAPSS